MPETYEPVEVKSEGFTLSRIIWRRFRRPMEGLHERVLAHNKGLAELPVELPVGTRFELIIPSPDEQVKSVPLLRLWGVSN